MKKSLVFSIVIVLVSHFSHCVYGQQWREQDTETPYRIAVVDYDGSTDERSKEIQAAFKALNPPHRVKFASGTAEEVLDWVSEGAVDFAVISPGAFAAAAEAPSCSAQQPNQRYATASGRGELSMWDCKYLITHSLLPTTSPLASLRRNARGCFLYQGLCVMTDKAFADLQNVFPGLSDGQLIKAAYDAGRIQFVFGDPLSLSSHIVPRAQLHLLGIDATECNEFSFGLSETLTLLMDEPTVLIEGRQRYRVGFVFDGTVFPVKQPAKIAPVERKSIIPVEASPLTPSNIFHKINLPLPEEPDQLLEAINALRQREGLLLRDGSTDSQFVDDLPTEVWVARPGFEPNDIRALRAGLLNTNQSDADPVFRDQSVCNLPGEHSEIDLLTQRVKKWADAGNVKLTKRESSLGDIFHSMRHSERRDGKRARLALVLSGGGAKCAYQAGAIMSIESQLKVLQQYSPLDSEGKKLRVDDGIPPRPDIDLVVGTSGGALNAVPVAVGLTREKADALCAIWENTDLATLGAPEKKVKLLLGALLGACLLFLTWIPAAAVRSWLLILSFLGKRRSDHGDADPGNVTASSASFIIIILTLRVICLLAIVGYLFVGYFRPEWIANWIPNQAPQYYWWVAVNLALSWAALFLLAGTAWRWFRRGNRATNGFELGLWRGLGAMAIVVLALAVALVFLVQSLFESKPMEQLVLNHFETLFEVGTQKEDAARKKTLGDCIKEKSERDLVVTGSRIGMKPPSDLYFYLPATNVDRRSRVAEPLYGMEGQRLDQGPGPACALDYIIASGTIFPIFPPHPAAGANNRYLNLVDGGFAHNTPVEAASRWGATHIIVIEASPELHYQPTGTFGGNVLAAYNHLFAQAQLTDVRSREGLEIYTLRPSKSLLGTLDFMRALSHEAALKGAEDVANGRFRQFSRPPRFAEDSKTLI